MERPSQPISHCGSHRRPRGLQRQHQLPRGEGAPLPGVPDPHRRSRRPGAGSARIRRGRRHQLAPISSCLAPRPWSISAIAAVSAPCPGWGSWWIRSCLSGRWLSRRCRWIPKPWRCCLIEGSGGGAPHHPKPRALTGGGRSPG